MFKFIKNFMNYLETQKKRTIAVKRFVITQQLVKFYEDLQASKGEYVDIPACTLAYQAMKKHVKTDKDVNRFYKKLELARLI